MTSPVAVGLTVIVIVTVTEILTGTGIETGGRTGTVQRLGMGTDEMKGGTWGNIGERTGEMPVIVTTAMAEMNGAAETGRIVMREMTAETGAGTVMGEGTETVEMGAGTEMPGIGVAGIEMGAETETELGIGIEMDPGTGMVTGTGGSETVAALSLRERMPRNPKMTI